MIALYPEIQARAHAEIDQVVGQETWPAPEDESRLPYLRAIIKEVGALILTILLQHVNISEKGSTHTRAVMDPNPSLLHRGLCV